MTQIQISLEGASAIGSQSIVLGILNGQKQFTVEHIEKLAAFFHVLPAIFLAFTCEQKCLLAMGVNKE